jgi:hypothetical protein
MELIVNTSKGYVWVLEKELLKGSKVNVPDV